MTMTAHIDHWAILTSDEYREEIHAQLARIFRRDGAAHYLTVVHGPTRQCCRLESWDDTALRIRVALEDSGVEVRHWWLWLGLLVPAREAS